MLVIERKYFAHFDVDCSLIQGFKIYIINVYVSVRTAKLDTARKIRILSWFWLQTLTHSFWLDSQIFKYAIMSKNHKIIFASVLKTLFAPDVTLRYLIENKLQYICT